MNICILDGYTTNPGDVSWAPLEALGNVTIYEFTKPDEIVERAKDAEILITNKTVLSAETINALPKLQYIGTLSTGFNVIDCQAAKQRGIPVCNVPTYCTTAVAQFTLLCYLTLQIKWSYIIKVFIKGIGLTAVTFVTGIQT